MKKKSVLLFVILAVFLQGCSVLMATQQPGKLNLSLFKVGTPRSHLLAEFGRPAVSEQRDGKTHEIFKFVQGYSGGVKAGRALFHGAADVFTLGLWEVVGTPAEVIIDGTEMAYEVTYDKDDKVDSVTLLKKKSK